MTDHFTLTYSFGVLVGDEPVTVEGSVTIHRALGEAALKDAFTHAVHGGYGRLWAAVKPKENKDGD